MRLFPKPSLRPRFDMPKPAAAPVNPARRTLGWPACFFSGVAMGCCTTIPGGDSGTVALIVGIYQRMIAAISRVDGVLLKLVLRGQIREAAQRVDLPFMSVILAGVGLGVVVMGTLMNYLMEHHLAMMWPIFFGMIGASCYLVAKLIHRWGPVEITGIIVGTMLALWMISQPGMQNPPDQWWYIFLCGLIGICALILPGISGAFILLIMGTYHDLTGVIKRAGQLDLTGPDIVTLVAFCSGCAVGLVACSKFLKWLLEHHGSPTMAFLCGIKIGSLWKIFPFQRDTTPLITDFDDKVFQPVPLNEIPVDGAFWQAIMLVLISGVAVLVLEYLALARAEQVVQDDGDEGLGARG